MNGYLDIHSHILPGVDDGSQNMDMTMQMLRQAYEEGVRYMIATPHYYPGHKNADYETIQQVFDEVKRQALTFFPDLVLLLGNEIYYKDEVTEFLSTKQIHTLNKSRYILVEFHVGMEYKKIASAVRKLTMKGYYPILAHVERYDALYKREERIEELIRMGAYIQVNTETILGGMFDGYKKYVMRLLAKGQVHFLGSDCHNTDNRRAVMEKAIKILKKKIDKDTLEKVVVYNPELFLKGEFIK